jgi:hypothetical protein
MGIKVFPFLPFMPPNAKGMGRGSDHIIVAIPIDVQHLHMGAGFAYLGGLEFPIAKGFIGLAFKPSFRN